MLEAYVAQFGPNFARNTGMLWHLGQLLERDRPSRKGQSLLRLALKHHRTDIARCSSTTTRWSRKRSKLNVPLKVYYDLVEYRKNLNTFHPPKGVYTSMGDAINSKVHDYGPALAGNDTSPVIQQQAPPGAASRAWG